MATNTEFAQDAQKIVKRQKLSNKNPMFVVTTHGSTVFVTSAYDGMIVAGFKTVKGQRGNGFICKYGPSNGGKFYKTRGGWLKGLVARFDTSFNSTHLNALSGWS